MYSLHSAKNLPEGVCSICRVLRRDLPIKRRFRAKTLATTVRGSEEGGGEMCRDSAQRVAEDYDDEDDVD